MGVLFCQDDQRDSDKRSKLGGARPSATPRGAGRRNPRLPVHAAGNDALVGARLGVQAVVDDAIHRVRLRPRQLSKCIFLRSRGEVHSIRKAVLGNEIIKG